MYILSIVQYVFIDEFKSNDDILYKVRSWSFLCMVFETVLADSSLWSSCLSRLCIKLHRVRPRAQQHGSLNFTGYVLVPDNMAHGDVVIYLLSLCCGKLLQSLTCILFILHFWDRVLCSPGYLGSLYVVEDDPEFLIFQPPPPKFWDIRHRLPCWFSLVLGMGTKSWLCWASTPLAELHPKPYTFPLSLLLWRSETTL